mmetsp:Transcript_10675/g.30634  ORF Transcript_10675/g.30634 Transcript_10675/m.30634 type:complete len:346 (-) Transcript_10675:670-1707(-)
MLPSFEDDDRSTSWNLSCSCMPSRLAPSTTRFTVRRHAKTAGPKARKAGPPTDLSSMPSAKPWSTPVTPTVRSPHTSSRRNMRGSRTSTAICRWSNSSMDMKYSSCKRSLFRRAVSSGRHCSWTLASCLLATAIALSMLNSMDWRRMALLALWPSIVAQMSRTIFSGLEHRTEPTPKTPWMVARRSPRISEVKTSTVYSWLRMFGVPSGMQRMVKISSRGEAEMSGSLLSSWAKSSKRSRGTFSSQRYSLPLRHSMITCSTPRPGSVGICSAMEWSKCSSKVGTLRRPRCRSSSGSASKIRHWFSLLPRMNSTMTWLNLRSVVTRISRLCSFSSDVQMEPLKARL